jgi:hypothetical protein
MAVALGAFLVVLALPWWALVSFLLLAGLLLQLVWRRYRVCILFYSVCLYRTPDWNWAHLVLENRMLSSLPIPFRE